MARIRLLLAALVLSVAAACSSDVVGPDTTAPSFDDAPYIGSGT